MTEPRTTDNTEMIDLPGAPQRWAGGPDGTTRAAVDAPPADRANTGGRGRTSARWLLALVGVLIVAGGTALIVSLAGGRPAASSAIGWMPATTTSYSEVRLDLPGDQRQKLAAFLAHFPGFKDQSQIEPKLTDVLDRIVRAASKDTQTWSTDIQPWFGGQIAIGMSAPGGTPAAMTVFGSGPAGTLGVVTISDRAKAIDWILKTTASLPTPLTRSTHGTADLFTASGEERSGAIAVTDKALIVGLTTEVKAAVDTNGAGTLGQNAEMKTALASVEQDYVVIGVARTRAQIEQMVAQLGEAGAGKLDETQLDETVIGMIPTWTATWGRFESDAFTVKTAGPSWSIGVDVANERSDVLSHVPAKTVLYIDAHDVGPTLKALVDKFRALPETKPVFDQVDQGLSLLGGFDAVVSWWGDSAFVVSPVADGTIGGGFVIKPRDAAAAQRLFSVLEGFIALGGSSQGLASRTEDHNGTKVTILDLSGVPGMSTTELPAGYKAEIAWATNADITVLGYGAAWVKEVLDAGPGSSLADDARFKALLERVGAENISTGYLDIAGIRALVEPLAQSMAPAEDWNEYTTEIKPYLEHLDAWIQGTRKNEGLDLGTGAITVR